MYIEWINHASFCIHHKDVKLVADPWIKGPAFNKGWSLLAETQHDDNFWKDVTHIWFSHEHPDHFHPPSLSVFMERASEITIVFQKTEDKRVVNYCKLKGFKVIELDEYSTHKINDLKVMIGKAPYYDSWILFDDGNKKVLNLNDCVYKSKKEYEKVFYKTGPVDTLMLQFGYASWEGNPRDGKRQKESALAKLKRIQICDSVFKSKFIIPHASFIIFSHEENFYLNKNNNSVKVACDFIKKNCSAQPVVLKPKDIWKIDVKESNDTEIEFYEKEKKRWEKPIYSSESIGLEELELSFKKYEEKVFKANNTLLIKFLVVLGFFKEIDFYVYDLNKVISYNHGKNVHVLESDYLEDKHIWLHSDSLNFILKNNFGFDTLSVNGRFRASDQNEKKLFKSFAIGSLNNMGLSLSFSIIFKKEIIIRVLKKVLSL